MYKTGAVNFNIPSGQSYESMSIGGFKGIQYSDNPLAVDSDSASDMLNVYLSDSGTLTTRPRIEYLGKTPSNWEKVINRINLTDEYVLYQVLINDVVHLYIRINSSEPIEVNLNNRIISKSKISAFYKDDKIYVLDNNYYVIKSNEDKTQFSMYLVENDDDTYMPVINVNDTSTATGSNILNDYYKKTFLWNEHQDLSKYVNAYNAKKIENKYYKSPKENLFNGTSNEIATKENLIYFPDNSYVGIESDSSHSIKTINWYTLNSNIYHISTISASDILDISLNKRFVLYRRINEDSSVGMLYGTYLGVYDVQKHISYEKYFENPLRKLYSYGKITNDGAFVLIGDSSSFSVYKIELNIVGETAELNVLESVFSGDNVVGSVSFFKNSDGFSFSVIHKSSDDTYYLHKINCSGLACVTSSNQISLNTDVVPFISSGNLSYYVAKENENYLVYDKSFSTSRSVLPPAGEVINDSLMVDDYGNLFITTRKNSVLTTYQSSQDTFKIYEHTDNYDNIIMNHYTSSMYAQRNIYFYYIEFEEINQPRFYVIYERDKQDLSIKTQNAFRFQNNYWFYGNSNRLWRTSLNNPTYIEEYNYIDVGNDDRITGINIISDNLLAVYKANSFYLISRNEISDDSYVYTCTETKGEVGNLPIGQTITTKYSELPLSIDDSGIFYISQLKNVTLSEHNTTSVSSLIDKKFLAEPNKESILTHNHRYWTYFIFPGDTAKVYVYDNRTNEWYYWELPEGNIISLWEENEIADNGDLFTITKYITAEGKIYALRTIDKVVRIDANNENDFYSTYEDSLSDRTQEIEWFWESQILPLGYTKYSKFYPALGYRKQLTHTGFLFTDTDENEEYSLDYSFKVYRKSLSSVAENSISGTLNRVRSILRKTYIPRINFLQIKLKNSDLDYIHQTNLPNTHNKLNLIQLKLKYKLMEETV